MEVLENDHGAHLNKAQSLIDAEQYQEALALLNDTLDDNPDDLTALFQIGEVLLKTDRIGLAANIYRYLTTKTQRSEVWNNLGRCYQRRESSDEARRCFNMALKLDPESPHARINLGVLDVNEGQPESAKRHALEALERMPESRQAVDVLAMAKFHLRDWSGWDDYLYSEGPPFRILRQYCVPQEQEWMGEPDKTVVIYREQGLGDEILYASCLDEVISRSKKVILDVDKRLVGLFKRSFNADVYGTGYSTDLEWVKRYNIDASAPIGRIPTFFRRQDSDFPGDPYLKPCPHRKRAYRAMLDGLGPGLKVGLAWTGGKKTDSVTRSDSQYRSLSLRLLEPLLRPENHYISLEYRDDNKSVHDMNTLGIHHWPWITQSQDYDDTAALVNELDYIIAIPTTVVHLAGALGTPCYCLTPEFPNWRFGLKGDMLWHKSVKLVRDQGNWRKTIKRLRHYLETRYHYPRRTGT